EHQEDVIYLHGSWSVGPEEVRHSRVTQDFGDYMFLKYTAGSVNLVINSEAQEPFPLLVTLDGFPLDESNKGTDVFIGEDGRSFIQVAENRLYNLVDSPEFGTHELRLAPNSDGFAFYAFTFGP
ncbi:MAG: hypothetical protein ACE5IA_07525, partial [Dehalococcoidia bacterium]